MVCVNWIRSERITNQSGPSSRVIFYRKQIEFLFVGSLMALFTPDAAFSACEVTNDGLGIILGMDLLFLVIASLRTFSSTIRSVCEQS